MRTCILDFHENEGIDTRPVEELDRVEPIPRLPVMSEAAADRETENRMRTMYALIFIYRRYSPASMTNPPKTQPLSFTWYQ